MVEDRRNGTRRREKEEVGRRPQKSFALHRNGKLEIQEVVIIEG